MYLWCLKPSVKKIKGLKVVDGDHFEFFRSDDVMTSYINNTVFLVS